ncbi:hypothetical protein Sjap_013010 [Stephania japonica]|uniref:WRKY domain-containing protein n=1 Tax=Stephania japonica TaxID=461633 RepID=A0AAP0IYX0_9MAGN
MADAPPPTASVEIEEEFDEGSNLLSLPEDGYAWKKYGQKFIKNIGKVRSYFRCQRSDCTAKKRAEWSPSNVANVRIIYEGTHSHATENSSSSSSQEATSASSVANQYNLYNQVFGRQNNT